jgi:signal transduction histidine kinase
MGDPTGLVQILANLLTNAAKYTGDDGRIFLSATDDENEVVFRIRDTGIGITPEMLPRIFDLFTQLPGAIDRSDGGVGIGLAIVDHLVRLHGGTIQALSEGLGRGTEFVVRLPLASTPRQRAAGMDRHYRE